MALHRLTDITLGVPNVAETVDYYTTYGLIPYASNTSGEHWFGTVDGGPQQLKIVEAPIRRLISVGIGADDRDDLGRIASSLDRFGVASSEAGDKLATKEPVTGLDVVVSVAPQIAPKPPEEPHLPNYRAPSLLKTDVVRPRKLGHIFLGSVDAETTQGFFTEGLGFKVSDVVRDAATFMRCSTDHHNMVVGPSPVNYLHHSSWEVDDIDAMGRAVNTVLEDHPERHTWGPGRLWVGANYFHYLRDPAGNQCEYYCGMDEITDDQVWKPGVHEVGALWGPRPISPSLIRPDDLAELMADMH